MRKYRYLTFADRKQISAWYQSNDRAADIAERLGMSVKTIYLELKRGEETDASGAAILDRNQRPAYNPVLAQQRLQANLKRRGRVAPEEPAEAAGAGLLPQAHSASIITSARISAKNFFILIPPILPGCVRNARTLVFVRRYYDYELI